MNLKSLAAILAKHLKTVYINATLLLLIIVLPSFAISIKRAIHKDSSELDNRSSFPVYGSKKEAINIWSDIRDMYRRSPKEYQAYIGWRNKPFKGNTVIVDGKYRTRIGIGHEISNSTWFFGGSTMWGFGAPDNQTIPSFFSKLTRKPSANFGEWGWQSRQSVNQLLTLLADGERPSMVIFYDGVNDTTNQCFSLQSAFIPVHSNTIRIKKALSQKYDLLHTLSEPFNLVIHKFKNKHLNTPQDNKCVYGNAYSRAVARHLVENWYLAHLLSKSYDFTFKAILQPTLHTSKLGKSAYSYFDEPRKLDAEKSSQSINSVYPLVREYAWEKCELDKEFCESFIDGSGFLIGSRPHFLDWNHVTGDVNRVVATKIIMNLKQKGD